MAVENKNGLGLGFGIKTTNPVAVETWTGPYASLQNAKDTIPIAIRYPTMFIRVLDAIGLYYFKGGVQDTDIVPMLTPTGFEPIEIPADSGVYTLEYNSTLKEIYRKDYLNFAVWSEIAEGQWMQVYPAILANLEEATITYQIDTSNLKTKLFIL